MNPDPLEQVEAEIRGQLLVANANGYTLKDPELPASLERHMSFIVPKLQQLIERERRLAYESAIQIVENEAAHYPERVFPEPDGYGSKPHLYTAAGARLLAKNAIDELRSALLSEEGSTNE